MEEEKPKPEEKKEIVSSEKKAEPQSALDDKKTIIKKTSELNESGVKQIPKEEAKGSGEKKSEEKKKPIQKKPVIKKTEAIINGKGLPISTKHCVAVCKFIKGKKIGDAIRDLEQVALGKRAVPMKGEIPHRKGKGMMSGRFPKKTSEHFIKLLKNLLANATVNGLEEPVVSEAIANLAQRPYGRFGRTRTRKKRSHVIIKCKERENGRKKNNSA